MPSTTPRLALPIPLDTDPVSDGAKATRDLGNAVDDLAAGKARRGGVTASTDANGDVTIAHGLGQTPTAVIVNLGNLASRVAVVTAFTPTTFKVRIYNSTTGATIPSTAGFVVYWIAVA